MAAAFPDDDVLEYNNNSVKNTNTSEVFANGGFEDSDEALTAEFRHRIGLLEEDADLTEAFKASMGMLTGEGNMGLDEIVWRMDEERDATISKFKFSKFVKDYFQKGNFGEWTDEPIKAPLLSAKSDIDKLASLSVFVALQRYMGDSKPPPSSQEQPRGKVPIMTKLFRTFESYERGRKSSSGSTGNEESFKIKKRSSWKKVFKRSNSEKESDLKRSGSKKSTGSDEFTYTQNLAEIMSKIPQDELDLIHYIIGHAILRKDLRDEVLCQICKQLTRNPSKESELRGWRLLSMCAGCFLPGEDFQKYFRCFLKDSPLDYKEYAGYARRMMSRIQTTGMRYHPPNWMEYEATKLKKYVMVPVSFADHHIESVEVDSATTAGEMCTKVAEKVGLKDDFGFSIFITIYDKVSSLGSGYDHVMDAISECEQVVRGRGHEEKEARWRLYFRKEVFCPWHDPALDQLSTNLIYRQICRGVRSEEYRCRSEEDLVKFAAQKLYIENNGILIPGKIQQDLQKTLPKSALADGNKSRDSWTQAIMACVQERGYVEKQTPVERVKQSVVYMAMRRWPLQFSGLFEAYKLTGPRLPKNDMVIAVNCKGIFILEDPYKITLAYPFFEVVEVVTTKAHKHKGQSFSLITIKGDEYTFLSPNSETIVRLVTKFLEGLRQRSIYCIGLQAYTLQGEGIDSPFSFKQGNFIEIQDEEPPNKKPDWVVGRCDATGTKGPFPLEAVYIIPTLEKPPPEFVFMFQGMSQKDYSTLPKQKGGVVLGKDTIGRHKKFGLDSAA